jgi:hypothetical protein
MQDGDDVILVLTRSVMSRDEQDANVLHIRVTAFATPKSPDLSPIDPVKLSDLHIAAPMREHEVPVAFAHFILIRCDLATSGDELKQAVASSAGHFYAQGDRARKAIDFLKDEFGSGDLEEAMEVADDRWIDQVATLDTFVHHDHIHCGDLYVACLKEMLCLTNPTSGIIVTAQYPCADMPAPDDKPINDVDALSVFSAHETELRTSMISCRSADGETVWVVAGLAQSTRQVDARSRARKL